MIMRNDDMRVPARHMYLVHTHHQSRMNLAYYDYDYNTLHTSRMNTSRRELMNKTRC